jgi:hypothetical protein
MIYVESESTYDEACYFTPAPNYSDEELNQYPEGVVLYHVRNLLMSGLLYTPARYEDHKQLGYYHVDLTPNGHEFLANIREDSNWNEVKKISSKIGFASLKMIAAISEGVATAAINKQLGN